MPGIWLVYRLVLRRRVLPQVPTSWYWPYYRGYQTLGHTRMVSSLIPVFIPGIDTSVHVHTTIDNQSLMLYIRPILVYTCFYTSFNTRCIYLPHTGPKISLRPHTRTRLVSKFLKGSQYQDQDGMEI